MKNKPQKETKRVAKNKIELKNEKGISIPFFIKNNINKFISINKDTYVLRSFREIISMILRNENISDINNLKREYKILFECLVKEYNSSSINDIHEIGNLFYYLKYVKENLGTEYTIKLLKLYKEHKNLRSIIKIIMTRYSVGVYPQKVTKNIVDMLEKIENNAFKLGAIERIISRSFSSNNQSYFNEEFLLYILNEIKNANNTKEVYLFTIIKRFDFINIDEKIIYNIIDYISKSDNISKIQYLISLIYNNRFCNIIIEWQKELLLNLVLKDETSNEERIGIISNVVNNVILKESSNYLGTNELEMIKRIPTMSIDELKNMLNKDDKIKRLENRKNNT